MKIDDIHFDKKISFMKIDIQGLDLEGMMGARNTIKEHKMPIILNMKVFFKTNEFKLPRSHKFYKRNRI